MNFDLHRDDYMPTSQTLIRYLDSLNRRCNFKQNIENVQFGNYKLRDFEFLKVIGKGNFGQVELVQLKNTNLKFAMKIVQLKEVNTQTEIMKLKTERRILMSLKNDFIVKLLWTHVDARCLYFLFEYVSGGELLKYMKIVKQFEESVCRFYMCEILLAIEHLHNMNIMYRDLKPENVLVDNYGHIKLIDFGFSKRCIGGKSFTLCGTPEYIAPEIFSNSGHGPAVDWWAYGVLLFEMLAGYCPFRTENNSLFLMHRKISQGIQSWPNHFSDTTKHLLSNLLCIQPEKRYAAKQVRVHEWFHTIDWSCVQKKGYEPPFKPSTFPIESTSAYESFDSEKFHNENLLNNDSLSSCSSKLSTFSEFLYP